MISLGSAPFLPPSPHEDFLVKFMDCPHTPFNMAITVDFQFKPAGKGIPFILNLELCRLVMFRTRLVDEFLYSLSLLCVVPRRLPREPRKKLKIFSLKFNLFLTFNGT